MIYVIIPIFKESWLLKNNLNNYRPIAQLSVFSKIIERVALKQIMQHLIRHNILHSQKVPIFLFKVLKLILLELTMILLLTI